MGHVNYCLVNGDILDRSYVEGLNDKYTRAKFGMTDISDILVFVVDERGYVVRLKSEDGVFTDTTKSIIHISNDREFLPFMKRQINGYTGKPVVFVHENHEGILIDSIKNKLGHTLEKMAERFI